MVYKNKKNKKDNMLAPKYVPQPFSAKAYHKNKSKPKIRFEVKKQEIFKF